MRCLSSRSLSSARRRAAVLWLAAVTFLGVAACARQAAAAEPDAPALAPAEEARLSQRAPLSGAQALEQLNLAPGAERRRLGQLRQALNPIQPPEPAIRIRALEGYLDYAEEDQIVYGPGRTLIRYGQYSLEADKVILDNRVMEVQAEGNVVMKIGNDTKNGNDTASRRHCQRSIRNG